MRLRFRLLTLMIIASVLMTLPGVLTGVPAFAQNPTPVVQTSKFDIPPEVLAHTDEWPLGNHDYANTRAAVNSAINAANVHTLGVAWTRALKGTSEWGAAAGNAVIANGIVYFQDLGANTYAVDIKDGKVIWLQEYSNQIFGPSGPGIGYGKVFVNSRIDRYSALDINTGKELWTFDTGFKNAAGSFQPSVFDHRVYLAAQAAPSGHGKIEYYSYRGGSTGMVYVLTPDDGKTLWQWQAVEEGFWGNPDVNSGGGMWYPAAIDTTTGITYWSTGNPSPIPGLKGYPNGSSRPGPNLYTNSLVALDHESGKMLWYNQVRPHDLFNLDLQISPMLATVTIDGAERNIVIGSGKVGIVYGFDAKTGETLWKTSIGLHQNDDLTAVPEGKVVFVAPGAWGGIETPMAYADGVVYALTLNVPSPYHATAFDAETPMEALNRSEGGSSLKDGTAEMVAIDATNGKVLWDKKFDGPALGGATVVNDLVFTASLDGILYALDRKTGDIVWQYQAPGGTNAWPAVAGDTIVWPIGLGGSPMVIALRLNAKGSIPTPERLRTPVLTPEGK